MQQPCQVHSSRLYRFREGEQPQVVLQAKVGHTGVMNSGFIPRVGDEIGAGIYTKLKEIPTKLADFCSDERSNHSLWFHSVGRYWLKAYDFLPYFSRNRERGASSNLVELTMPDAKVAKSAVAVLNSSIFYYWWMLQCDEFHLLKSQALSFPFPPSLIEDRNLYKAVDDLMKDYQLKAVRKVMKAGGSTIEMDEIHARLSRDFIREIDRIIAPHYQLIDTEVAYLDKYDEEFRNDDE